MEIEAEVSVVIEPKDHPTVEVLDDEVIVRPQGRNDLLLSLLTVDAARWLGELQAGLGL